MRIDESRTGIASKPPIPEGPKLRGDDVGDGTAPPSNPSAAATSQSNKPIDTPTGSDATPPVGTTPKLSKAEQLRINKEAGGAFEQLTEKEFAKISDLSLGSQLTLITASGRRPRLDFISRDELTGVYGCVDCKSSATAPLTRVQKPAYREIEESGGTIAGKGKPGFPGGTIIPPTKVQILRPK